MENNLSIVKDQFKELPNNIEAEQKDIFLNQRYQQFLQIHLNHNYRIQNFRQRCIPLEVCQFRYRHWAGIIAAAQAPMY